MFINIDNVFGQFLRLLNIYYTRVPNDVSMRNNDDINSYLSRHKIEELSVINKQYVKNKLIVLYEEFLKEERTIEEASRKLFDCSEFNYPFFSLYLYYDGINELYKDNLKSNFKLYFLDKSPRELLKFIAGDLIPSTFISNEGKERIRNKANELLKNKNQWSQSDLDKGQFFKEGWNNFLGFIKQTSDEIELNKEELNNSKTLHAFISTYIKKGFIIPTEEEASIDKVFMEMANKNDGKKLEEK